MARAPEAARRAADIRMSLRGVCSVTHLRSAAVALGCALAVSTIVNAAGVPKVLKPRLVLGDPIWRELPVRTDLQAHYDRVWQTAVDTALEHNFEIATMD